MGNFPSEFLNWSNCSYVKIEIHEIYSLFGTSILGGMENGRKKMRREIIILVCLVGKKMRGGR